MAVEISGKTGIVMPQGDTQVALFKYIPSGAPLPTENIGPIWSDDYAATMVWRTVGTFTGYVSTNIGQVIYVESSTPPPGYVKSSGQTLSGAPYLQLIAFRGSAVLKDLRGEFIRSLDDGRGKDTGRALGSTQSDASRVLMNGSSQTNSPQGNSSTGIITHKPNAEMIGIEATFWGSYTNRVGLSAAMDTTYGSASETRPSNVALLACIKY